ncbi:MAG: hypothetical protein U9Q74_09135 [Gemmatimonadota bacterium]|nr:hypothetical protein [Gemmatimonadota bacterium]
MTRPTADRAGRGSAGGASRNGTPLLDWVASRAPAAPDELLAHMRADLDAHSAGVSPLLDAADAALERVLRASDKERRTALDLLSADAYVTYAFEAAAAEPATLVQAADDAMRRVSAIAVRHLDDLRNGA